MGLKLLFTTIKSKKAEEVSYHSVSLSFSFLKSTKNFNLLLFQHFLQSSKSQQNRLMFHLFIYLIIFNQYMS